MVQVATEGNGNDNNNDIGNPTIRSQFKASLAELTHYHRQADDIKEGLKESIIAVSQKYNVDKKLVRKLARTMYKANYGSLQEENRHFETIYELVVEGKLRDDPVDPQDGNCDDQQDL